MACIVADCHDVLDNHTCAHGRRLHAIFAVDRRQFCSALQFYLRRAACECDDVWWSTILIESTPSSNLPAHNRSSFGAPQSSKLPAPCCQTLNSYWQSAGTHMNYNDTHATCNHCKCESTGYFRAATHHRHLHALARIVLTMVCVKAQLYVATSLD